ncbi:Phosphoheptose isomerase [Tepidimonas thermarum]|uniref:Phosphoheptose isomerase n=1 Tax=Tepidimonas thermarum TaxID=335431 RepID=A0A554X2D7_9BURK|nr:SIS domain-containing protein [Tepidimonas thermarum]TSE30017.1 Phosphoheptose isomerase [Tepidimonas thermarum]
MLLHRIQQHFVDGADLQYQCAQAVGPALEAAAAALLAGLTGGGKALVWGAGVSAVLAQAFVAQWVGRFERERPELPALALGGHPLAGVTAGVDGAGPAVVRQLRALGVPGDVLVVIAAAPTADALALIAAAHEREMVVVALTGARPGELPDVLKDTDVLVTVPTERPARVYEAHLVALHALCDAIDVQLLGEETETENLEP